MALTISDPRSALIVVDLPKGLVSAISALIWDGVVERSQTLVIALLDSDMAREPA